MSGTPIRSVCGILCGQRKSAKLHRFQKLQKSKENPRNPKISGVVLELLTRFELVALGVYEISEDVVTVHIVYMESQAQSNPTLCERPKYRGIGRALIAYGIKLSVDAGFNGDVTLDAKTPELARHYERDFGALLIPGRKRGAAPRYLICDEAARDIFVSYFEEG